MAGTDKVHCTSRSLYYTGVEVDCLEEGNEVHSNS